MRQLLAAAVLSAFAGAAHAADVPAVSRVDAVTVFPSGAEVTRIAKVTLEKGAHTLIVDDLPASALQGSIRVEGKASGKLEIGSVDTRRLFVSRNEAEVAETERRRLEDEAEKLRDGRAILEAEVQAAETQKSLIANLAQLPTRPAPAQGGERSEDWPQVLALIASGTREAQRLAADANVKIRDVDRKIEDIEKKLASLAPAKEERTEVRVAIDAAAPLEAEMIVRYQVPAASWTALYDARLASGTKTQAPKLDLVRRASITQSSGEAWDDVAITLSTTRPTAGAQAPEVYPLIVDFEPERVIKPMAGAPPAPATRNLESQDGLAAAPEAMADADEGRLAKRAAPKLEAATTQQAAVVDAPFQALFAVPGRLSVPATGEAKRVQILADSIEPALLVRTVPKSDAKAYLYAKLVLPKGSPLLPGPVSLFRDGTFVGTGSLPLISPGEDHDLGFGIDDLVRVKHSVAEEKRGETGLISTSRTDSRNYKITVKNLHERAIPVVVLDQLPVSQNQDIRVELTSRMAPTRENVEDRRGVMAWEFKLEPEQEQVIDFAYRVTWPSAKGIVYR